MMIWERAAARISCQRLGTIIGAIEDSTAMPIKPFERLPCQGCHFTRSRWENQMPAPEPMLASLLRLRYPPCCSEAISPAVLEVPFPVALPAVNEDAQSNQEDYGHANPQQKQNGNVDYHQQVVHYVLRFSTFFVSTSSVANRYGLVNPSSVAAHNRVNTLWSPHILPLSISI
jgi:hypothetical protein